jgi:hypothetical protein
MTLCALMVLGSFVLIGYVVTITRPSSDRKMLETLAEWIRKQ